ncbi:MAG: DEAD/DEAH box helicase [Candidatus Omnitrophota bacterium]|nr:DEAD/DEAH box helicase [Candidatus Omnitrophota bacterium]MBU1895203.1 DEAD/DEAH box helicase [Candidatus Omnitrophota bacterium]
MKKEIKTNTSFDGLGIAPKIIEVLDRLKFVCPTPIQHKAIPIAIEGTDIIGVAQTGTGKTLAFTIPVVQRLAKNMGKCLVVVPTRELAMQVDDTFRKIATGFGINTVVIIGGVAMQLQLKALKKNPRIIIATPGRLVDHLQQKTMRLNEVEVLILDEADRMLDMGFKPDIERIIKFVSQKRQTMLFSATIPGEVVSIGTKHMKLPVHIEVAPSGTAAERIIQEVFIVKREAKKTLLAKLLNEYCGSVLIFSRTKRGASKIKRMIKEMGHKVAEIHSDRTLRQRKEALEGFKRGYYRILVATDIAARGIDVIGIETVINYDLPDDAENYVHRIGRTGRAGHEGRAISFATPEQGKDVRSIETLIKTALPISEHPEFSSEKFVLSKTSNQKPRSSSNMRNKKRPPRKRWR